MRFRATCSRHGFSRRGGCGGFDYRLFDFVGLFAEAIHGHPYKDLAASQKKTLIGKFENDVSDHMPIWIRLPKPYPGQPTHPGA